MDVLYIGSGISALQALDKRYDNHVKVCINNAWRVFENSQFGYWLHPSDFPRENYPPTSNFKEEIGYKQYSQVLEDNKALIGLEAFTGHRLEISMGYTTFFQGLYWIMLGLKPQNIHLLGLDHDYNQDKLAKWIEDGKPNIQNHFNNSKGSKNVNEWAKDYFAEYESDFVYGHGTPDPMRFGEDYIRKFMELAMVNAAKLNISIVNHSRRPSPFNVFPRES